MRTIQRHHHCACAPSLTGERRQEEGDRSRGAAMAAARRLSELLQEQQEPFLVDAGKTRRLRRVRGGGGGGGGGEATCCPVAVAACRRLLKLCNHGLKKRRGAVGGGGLRRALSKVLCSKAMRRVLLRWEDLGGGCFPGGGGADREFRRLRRSSGHSGECDARAMEFDADDEGERARWKTHMEVDSSLQLSPVSVLELHSDDDDDSPVRSRWEDEGPSTSGSSPPSEDFLGATSPCFAYSVNDKTRAMEMEVDGEEEEGLAMARTTAKSMVEQISSWERIAGDIAKIPAMVELDLSRSAQQWRRGLEPEVREIGARIETLIFEEIRGETVCDMLASHCTLATPC